MASMSPQIPAHLLARGNAVRQQESVAAAEQPEAVAAAGPSTIVSAQSSTITPPTLPVPRYEEEEEEDDEDEDAYAPALPPDLAASRANPSGAPKPPLSPPLRRTFGPARGPLPLRREEEEEESEEEEEVGPAPPPPPGVGPSCAREDEVTVFMQKEAQRRQAVEEAARPKVLQRDEWMLVPPSSSDLLSTLDPTKLSKPRQFSRSTAPPKKVDNTLWTETPAERQQRLADEVMGRKRRVENADPDVDPDAKDDASKRRKHDAELQRQVDEYTRTRRGPSLLEARAQEEAKVKKGASEEPAAIWDHSRDMSLGGRLMDEKDRRRVIQDSKGLSDRFGASKGGSFL